MGDERKTRAQLLAELAELRGRVAELEQTEERLKGSERQLAEAQQIAHIGSWGWEIRENRISWSDEMYRIYGLAPAAFDASFESYQERIHPEDRDYVQMVIAEACETHRPFSVHHRIVRPDGSVRTLYERGEVVVDGNGHPVRLVGTCQDVTERKAAEDALWESEQRFRTFFENAAFGIGVIRLSDGPPSGNEYIAECNPAFRRFFGYPEEALLRKRLADLYPPEDLEKNLSLLQAVVAGHREFYAVEQRFLREGAAFRWGRQSISLFRDPESRPTYAVMMVEDVTERKAAEATLREREAQLLESQKLESIGRLAGGVAHDFNNKLAIIRGYVDLALDDVSESTRLYRNLLQIHQAVLSAASLTDQLLKFSKRQPMDKQPTDLNRHLSDLQKMMGRVLREDIALDLDLETGLETLVADPGNIDQVVTNLLLNARDAMPEGGRLRIETRNVTVDEFYCQEVPEARPGRFLRLAVSDTGVGMSADVRMRLFEPFFTTKASGKGTGLGLSVVYGIVQSHEGWITVESQPGQGSRFEIYLPAASGQAVPMQEEYRPVPLDSFAGQGERVLLVEDDDGLREMTAQALKEQGYVVCACSTTAQATEAFQQSELPFDLVLSDVVLPDGRGPELVSGLLKAQPDLAVILVTGYTDERADREYIQKEGLLLLQKPVPLDVLFKHVREALNRPEAPE